MPAPDAADLYGRPVNDQPPVTLQVMQEARLEVLGD